MKRWHINKHGIPATCKAKKGNCPLGGEGEHYESKEDAEQTAHSTHEHNYGILPGVNRKGNNVRKLEEKVNNMSDEEVDNLRAKIDKEVGENYTAKVASGNRLVQVPWEDLDNRQALEYFSKHYMEDEAVDTTADVLDKHLDFRDSLYDVILDVYPEYENNYEFYDYWYSDSIDNIDSLEYYVGFIEDEIDDDFKNEMDGFYAEHGIDIDINEKGEGYGLNEGFGMDNELVKFLKHHHEETRAKMVLDFLD